MSTPRVFPLRSTWLPLGAALLVVCVAGRMQALADGDGQGSVAPSLLDRLSEEAAHWADRGARPLALLTADNHSWPGVLVGQPPRFVFALPASAVVANLPKEGTLQSAAGLAGKASFRFANGELGLAVYDTEFDAAPGGASLEAFEPADKQPRRGMLALLADGPSPGVIALPHAGHELEDLHLARYAGSALVATDGRLLGLAPSSHPLRSNCSACHGASDVYGLRDVPASSWLGLAGDCPACPGAHAHGQGSHLVLSPHLSPQGLLQLRYKLHELTSYAGRRNNTTGWMASAEGAAYMSAFVPAAVLRRTLEDLEAGRSPANAYLGVVLEDVREQAQHAAYYLNRSGLAYVDALQATNGGQSDPYRIYASIDPRQNSPTPLSTSVRVSGVIAASPAGRAGLAARMQIVALDGVVVRDVAHALRMVARRRPGESIRCTVAGRDEPIVFELGDRESDAVVLPSAVSVGLVVLPLSNELAAFLERDLGDGGVVVHEVRTGSAAANAGLVRGDVLRRGGGAPIRDLGELDAVLGAGKGEVEFDVERASGQIEQVRLAVVPGKAGRSR